MKRYLIGVILVSLLMSMAAVSATAQAIQNVELHGYMQNRFYAPESGNMRIVAERISISARATVNETSTAYVEIYHHPYITAAEPAEQYRTYVESAYYDMPLGAGRLRFGKGRQLNFGIVPTATNRKTTQYGIVPETFTKDRIVGAQYTRKSGIFDGGISLYTDTSLGTSNIGDYPSVDAADVVKHYVDKDIPSNLSGEMAASIRFGISKPCFQAHISGATGQLNETDIATLNGVYGLASTDDAHNKYGADATYAHGNFVAQAEYYVGNFSFLKITGYNLLVGYTLPKQQRITLRYNALDNDRAAVAGQTQTYDTQQWILGFVQPIAKNVWAEFQYEKNSADVPAGSPEPSNDLLFVELFTGF
ncbi:MAG: hypothetical protein ABFD49_10350 [Armatimonadota bacterium]|nr:hypothetical protein [bacterium]